MSKKIYTLLWVLWLVAFAILEGFAYVDPQEGDTLSEQVWWTTQHPAAKFAVGGFLVWLLLHLFKLDSVLMDWINKHGGEKK